MDKKQILKAVAEKAEEENPHHFETLLPVAIILNVEAMDKPPTEEDFKSMSGFAEILGEEGDVLLWGGKRKKDNERAAELFNRLARSIAIMSFVPGGITFLGHHFENAPEEPDND